MKYSINEERARQAKIMNSFYDYIPGSATEEYCAAVDKAVWIAEAQKASVSAEHHEKIDALLDRYARKLADNMNKGFEIECRCPSVLISGPANFPVRKKEKQNIARDKNMREWLEIKAIIDKIQSVGTGHAGISSDDPNALDQLREKLAKLEAMQEKMKLANAYYRKHKTLVGFDGFTDEQALKMDAAIKSDYWGRPYPTYGLANNNANIKRILGRIVELERLAAKPADGWKFDGGEVVINKDLNRLQALFDSKPDDIMRNTLKRNGFKWAPSQGAWQRQYTDNAVRVARQLFKEVE